MTSRCEFAAPQSLSPPVIIFFFNEASMGYSIRKQNSSFTTADNFEDFVNSMISRIISR